MGLRGKCSTCGEPLPADAPAGNCPRCLMGFLLGGADEEFAAGGESLPRRFGDYELLERIARGGMGVIYRARHTKLNRVVALKMILAGHLATPEQVQRFRAEAEAAARLEHPHIVPIYEVGEHDDQQFFTMKLVEGTDLARQIGEGAWREAEGTRIASFVATLARAVHHAHQRGILHRDLKPTNILIDAQGEPHVTDFGLARWLESDSRLTHSAAVLGTPSYMSPEQAAGKNEALTTAVDVYGLGAIFYELLTGTPPFSADTPLETMRQVVEDEPVPPSKCTGKRLDAGRASVSPRRESETETRMELPVASPRRAEDSVALPSSSGSQKREQTRRIAPRATRLAPDLEVICLKCLAKDPARRYRTAEALAEDLERWLRHEPIEARPSTVIERAIKWTRRKPVTAAVATVVTLASVAVLVVAWNYQAQLHRRELATAQQRQRALEALAELGFVGTEASFANGEAPRAMAFLARALRQNPSNRWAAERLISALTYRSFALPVLEPIAHTGAIHSVQFSPDGTRLLMAGEDGAARLRDARTGAAVGSPLRHDGPIRIARFSRDGRFIITASDDKTARLWDANTGQPFGAPMVHDAPLRTAEFSRDGTKVVTTAARLARVWDARTGAPLSEWLPHNTTEPYVRSAQLSPDGQRVLTTDGQSARLWLATNSGPLRRDKLGTGLAQFAGFSPDGRRIVVGSGDNTAHIWRLDDTNAPVRTAAHAGDVDAVEFSPDGGRIVTASKDRTARVWDAHTGEPVSSPMLHEGRVWFAHFSPDGLRVLTIAEDRTARVWDAESGEALCEPLLHPRAVNAADFSPDGQFVATACADGLVRVWDVRAGRAIGEPAWRYLGNPDRSDSVRNSSHIVQLTNLFPAEAVAEHLKHDAASVTAHLGPDGRWLIARDAEGLVRIHDEATGSPLTALFRHDEPMRNLAVAPDRKVFATVIRDHTVRVWDTATGRLLHAKAEHTGALIDPVFTPDGERLLVAPNPMALQLWDVETGRPLGEPFSHHKASLLCARFSPDGKLLATGSYDRTALVCDASTGAVRLPALQHDGFVRCVEFSSDGRRLVTASVDRTAQVWDAQTGRPLTEPLRHAAEVRWATFSPDGQHIATWSADGTARVWDARLGQPLTEPLWHSLRDDLPSFLGRFSSSGQLICHPRPYLHQTWDLPAAPLPVPDWLPALAESLGGRRFNENGGLEIVPAGEFLRWRRAAELTPSTNFYSRWATWFFADRSTRNITPSSSLTVSEYVRRQAKEGNWPLMKNFVGEAARLAPTNGLALLRLARARTRQAFESRGPAALRWRDEADFFSARALQLAPAEREAWIARVEFLKNTNEKQEALRVAAEALKRFPDDAVIRGLPARIGSVESSRAPK